MTKENFVNATNNCASAVIALGVTHLVGEVVNAVAPVPVKPGAIALRFIGKAGVAMITDNQIKEPVKETFTPIAETVYDIAENAKSKRKERKLNKVKKVKTKVVGA